MRTAPTPALQARCLKLAGEGLSLRAVARAVGCSHTLVNKFVRPERGPLRANAPRLTAATRDAVRVLDATGLPRHRIAATLGIGKSTVTHILGPIHPPSTPEQVAAIREAFACGLLIADIAARFGTTLGRVKKLTYGLPRRVKPTRARNRGRTGSYPQPSVRSRSN